MSGAARQKLWIRNRRHVVISLRTIGFALLILLSGCVGRPVYVNSLIHRPPQAVGVMDGDTIEVVSGVIGQQRVTAISVIHSEEESGRLKICGAIFLAAPDERTLDELGRYVSDSSSKLTFGSESPVLIPSRFLRFYSRVVPGGILASKDTDLKSLEGNCVMADVAWRDDFRSAPRLTLGRTIYR